MSNTENMVIALIGVDGLVRGEHYILEKSKEISIGRSRSCSISLRRTPAYLAQTPEEREEDHDFNTVSRDHVHLLVEDENIVLDDFSTNGTFVNSVAIGSKETVPLANPILVRLGAREALEVKLMTNEDYEKSRDSVSNGVPEDESDIKVDALELDGGEDDALLTATSKSE